MEYCIVHTKSGKILQNARKDRWWLSDIESFNSIYLEMHGPLIKLYNRWLPSELSVSDFTLLHYRVRIKL